ncbi:unnamed protein product, partial [Ectocarpus sp. 12 AP-2014]
SGYQEKGGIPLPRLLDASAAAASSAKEPSPVAQEPDPPVAVTAVDLESVGGSVLSDVVHLLISLLRQSTPVKPLVSAVAHVLTLVGSLSGGGLAGGARALERHPALGSLLRALCIRIPDSSVRRSACSVLHRASAWQALGRDPSCCSEGGGGG